MMTNPSDPAFPLPGGAENIPPEVAGLTKREEFAKAAMIGLLSSQFKYEDLADYAIKARVMADLMIAELNKEKP